MICKWTGFICLNGCSSLLWQAKVHVTVTSAVLTPAGRFGGLLHSNRHLKPSYSVRRNLFLCSVTIALLFSVGSNLSWNCLTLIPHPKLENEGYKECKKVERDYLLLPPSPEGRKDGWAVPQLLPHLSFGKAMKRIRAQSSDYWSHPHPLPVPSTGKGTGNSWDCAQDSGSFIP